MTVYLDTSFLVALLTDDPLAPRAEAYVLQARPAFLLSDFAAAEFAAVVARRVRTREVSEQLGRLLFDAFDAWSARSATRVATEADDIRAAAAILRRLDLNLRAPDALHVATAARLGVPLATFDVRLAAAAAAFGVKTVTV